MDNQPAEERTRDNIEQMDINTGGLTDADTGGDASAVPLLGGLTGGDAGGLQSDFDDTTDQDPGQATGTGDLPRIPTS